MREEATHMLFALLCNLSPNNIAGKRSNGSIKWFGSSFVSMCTFAHSYVDHNYTQKPITTKCRLVSRRNSAQWWNRRCEESETFLCGVLLMRFHATATHLSCTLSFTHCLSQFLSISLSSKNAFFNFYHCLHSSATTSHRFQCRHKHFHLRQVNSLREILKRFRLTATKLNEIMKIDLHSNQWNLCVIILLVQWILWRCTWTMACQLVGFSLLWLLTCTAIRGDHVVQNTTVAATNIESTIGTPALLINPTSITSQNTTDGQYEVRSTDD